MSNGHTTITGKSAPPLGDLRLMGKGQTVFLKEGATARKDWPRYADALINAVSRGADVRWLE